MKREEVFIENKRRNAEALPIRTTLCGRYEVGRVLGRGGFGVTYLAWDHRYDLAVAIKELFPSPQETGIDRKVQNGQILPDLDIPNRNIRLPDGQVVLFSSVFAKEVANFQAEAKKMVGFRKMANIATVIDDFTAHNTAYYVMEFYKGETLWDVWEKAGMRPWSLDEVLEVLFPMIKALEKVHAKGLVHRDFKPHNVLICKDEEENVVLIDFGLAKALGSSGMISTKGELGTPLYAPYEQQSRIHKHGPYSDVYSVAATFYQLLTGELPSLSKDREEYVREGYKDPMVFPEKDLPKGLKKVLDKAIAIYPKDRYQTMQAFREAIENCLATSEERFLKDIQEVLAQPVAPPAKPIVAPPAKPAQEPRAPQAGDRVVHTLGGVMFAFRYCPPTTTPFMMGDATWDDAKPHKVHLTKGFWMAETPITQEQFSVFVHEKQYQTQAEREGGAWIWNGKEFNKDPKANWRTVYPGPKRPVVAVSWNDATAFCAWLSERLHHVEADLPTEAQWEYAARAGGKGIYGLNHKKQEITEATLAEVAWFGKTSDIGTNEVGKLNPNAFGLYDMLGNVWEWCRDVYDSGFYQDDQKDPVNLTKNSSTRVVRGASFGSSLRILRVGFRSNGHDVNRNYELGFRPQYIRV